MVEQGFIGYGRQNLLEGLEVGGTGDFAAVGPPENEVAESQHVQEKLVYFVQQVIAVLVQKGRRHLFGQAFGCGVRC
jgi:hypothetical protein